MNNIWLIQDQEDQVIISGKTRQEVIQKAIDWASECSYFSHDLSDQDFYNSIIKKYKRALDTKVIDVIMVSANNFHMIREYKEVTNP